MACVDNLGTGADPFDSLTHCSLAKRSVFNTIPCLKALRPSTGISLKLLLKGIAILIIKFMLVFIKFLSIVLIIESFTFRIPYHLRVFIIQARMTLVT